MLVWHSPVTEISKYMWNNIWLHTVIDNTICNNNVKDGMIHDIASFWLPDPVIYTSKFFIPNILSWQKAQYNLLCSVLVTSQSHSITKLLYHIPFQAPSVNFLLQL